MDVLTSETCWALSKEIIKQVTSSWSLFTQRSYEVCCLYGHFFYPFFSYSFDSLFYHCIQDVPRGKVNILGGHSIGHSKQKYIFIWTCVLFRMVSEIELFECTTAKLLIRKRYYVYALFLIPVFIVQETELVQFVINVRKFRRQHQCTLQLVWRHGVLFVWVRLDVPLCRR